MESLSLSKNSFQNPTQNSYNGLISKINKVKVYSKCPVNLYIDYFLNQLRFQWNFGLVNFPEGSYFRSVILIDIESFDQGDQIFVLIEKFYKRLKLGDFMKILYIGGEFKKDWIERTSKKLNRNDFKFELSNSKGLIQSCEYAIKLAMKLNEPIHLSLFKKNVTKEQILMLSNFKKINSKFCYFLNIFHSTNKLFLGDVTLSHNLNVSFVKNILCADEQLRFFFHEIAKLRALSVQIKLKCLNGEMLLRSKPGNIWTLQNDALYNRCYGINNYTHYSASLSINTFKLPEIYLQVEFNITLLNRQKYKMQKSFSIQVNNSKQKIQEVHKFMQNEQRNHYSQMAKKSRLELSIGEKILITQFEGKNEYLSYQKEFFS